MFWYIALEYFYFLFAAGSLVGSRSCVEPQGRVQGSAHGAECIGPTLYVCCGLGISLGLERVQGSAHRAECIGPTLYVCCGLGISLGLGRVQSLGFLDPTSLFPETPSGEEVEEEGEIISGIE